MNRNNSRISLKETILMTLGHPVVKVNVTDDQLNMSIDKAIRKLWRWFKNFSIENYYVITVTEEMVNTRKIHLPSTINAVIEVIPMNSQADSNSAIFQPTDYTMTRSVMLNGAYMYPLSMVDYFAAMTRINTMRIMMGSDTFAFNWNKFEGVFCPLFNFSVGDQICIRVNEIYSPEELNENYELTAGMVSAGILFDDETLIDLSVAYTKQVMGQTLSKYEGMTLPGGQIISGQALLQMGREDEQIILQRLKDETVDMIYTG